MYPFQFCEILVGIAAVLSGGYIFQRSAFLFADLRSKKGQIIAFAFGVAVTFAIATIFIPCLYSIVGLVNPFKQLALGILLLILWWTVFFLARAHTAHKAQQLKTS